LAQLYSSPISPHPSAASPLAPPDSGVTGAALPSSYPLARPTPTHTHASSHAEPLEVTYPPPPTHWFDPPAHTRVLPLSLHWPPMLAHRPPLPTNCAWQPFPQVLTPPTHTLPPTIHWPPVLAYCPPPPTGCASQLVPQVLTPHTRASSYYLYPGRQCLPAALPPLPTADNSAGADPPPHMLSSSVYT